MMRQNVGGLDRALRLVLGVILVLTGWFFHSIVVAVVGALGFLSGALGYCWLYVPFGICTARSPSQTRR